MEEGGKLSDLSNAAGFLVGFLPLAIAVFVLYVKKPKRWWRLLAAFGLFTLAGLQVWLLESYLHVILPVAQITKLFEPADYMQGVANANAWLYMFPAISGALGVNYLSAVLSIGDDGGHNVVRERCSERNS